MGSLGIEFNHLALLTRIPDQSGIGSWMSALADSFTEPLNFDERGEQSQGLRSYRIEKTTDGFITWQRNYDGSWIRLYFFDLQPRSFPADYEAPCVYQQTSPEFGFYPQKHHQSCKT